MPHVFDYSGWRPNPADLVAAGVLGVCRYLAPKVTDEWKRITIREYEALLAEGLPVALVWEDYDSAWTEGYDLGFSFGQEAREQAREIGWPNHRPLYIAVDTNVSPELLPVAVAHVRGFVEAQNLGPQGVYGEGSVIDACEAAGITAWGWEAAASSWSPPSALRELKQLTTKSYPQFPPAAYDENDVFVADWGQHPLKGEVMFQVYKDVRGQHWRVADDGLSRVPVSGTALAVDTWNSMAKWKRPIVTCDAPTQAWLDTVPNMNLLALAATQAQVQGLTVQISNLDKRVANLEARLAAGVKISGTVTA